MKKLELFPIPTNYGGTRHKTWPVLNNDQPDILQQFLEIGIPFLRLKPWLALCDFHPHVGVDPEACIE
jgi:hypothetical protein